jgi:hypothetical protein
MKPRHLIASPLSKLEKSVDMERGIQEGGKGPITSSLYSKKVLSNKTLQCHNLSQPIKEFFLAALGPRIPKYSTPSNILPPQVK